MSPRRQIERAATLDRLEHQRDGRNIRDFPGILRDWAAAQHSHTGAILIYRIDHREFELVARGIQRWLSLYPEPAQWIDLAVLEALQLLP